VEDRVEALVVFGATGDLAKLETFPGPYDRLIGAALDGDEWLFAPQETVESAWRIVDPILGDVVPLHVYDRGTWGPPEASALLPAGDSWHDPA